MISGSSLYSSADTHIFRNVLNPAKILPPIHVEYYVELVGILKMDDVIEEETKRPVTDLSLGWSVDFQLDVFQCQFLDLVQ